MKTKKKQFGTLCVIITLLITTLFIISSCKKKSETTTPSQTEVEKAVSTVVEQTECPVMGGPINKELFTVYKDQKVYFCCAGCKEAFEKEPEKYLAKLPQFKK